MTADAWTLTTHEFRLLWGDEPGSAPYPQTFAYGGESESFIDDDARRLAEKQIRSALHKQSSPMKETAFTAFHRPMLSIDVIGAYSVGGVVTRFRAHGAWRGQSEPAFVAVQESRDDPTVGGQVDIFVHDIKGWVPALLASFPASRGAGRLPTDPEVPMQARPVADGTLPAVSRSASEETAAAAFVHLVPTMGAVVTVRAGSLADGMQPEHLDVQVADIADDGRYALLVDSPAVALGIDGDPLVKLINKTCNATRNRHRARTEFE